MPSSASYTLRPSILDDLVCLGYVEGRNIVIEYRAFEERAERFPEIIAEFVRLKVDVIVSSSTHGWKLGQGPALDQEHRLMKQGEAG